MESLASIEAARLIAPTPARGAGGCRREARLSWRGLFSCGRRRDPVREEHPVYGALPYRRIHIGDEEVCAYCGYDKASVDTRFQAACPFCERCGHQWASKKPGQKVDGSVAIWAEEKVSESNFPRAMKGQRGER